MSKKMKDPDKKDLELARVLWDYHCLGEEPQAADLIFVLGSHDLRVAERAVELYHQGLAADILFSGKRGVLTKEWAETEAERFAEVARERGVPADHILIEPEATNTGENIRFGYRLLQERGLLPQSMILVQKPYMERRTRATFLKQWPGAAVRISVTSPRISFEEYPTDEIPLAQVIHILVGDLVRLRDYPARGFQVAEQIPAEVWAATEELIRRGYTEHLPGREN